MYDQNDRNNRNEMNDSNAKSNGLMYFVIGALVLAVIGIGYMSAQEANDVDGYAVMEPAAGDEDETSRFEFRADEDGLEASTTDDE